MGNKFHRKKKKKIKNAGDEFILEDYEIYDSTNCNRQTSIIHFNHKKIIPKKHVIKKIHKKQSPILIPKKTKNEKF